MKKFAVNILYLEKGVSTVRLPFCDGEKILYLLLGANRDCESLEVLVKADMGPDRGKNSVLRDLSGDAEIL